MWQYHEIAESIRKKGKRSLSTKTLKIEAEGLWEKRQQFFQSWQQ